MVHSQTLDPAGGEVHTGQRVDKLAFYGSATGSEGAHRDGFLEQAAGFGGAQTMWMLKASRTQTAVNGRAAHLQQERLGLLGQLQLAAPLQHLHHLW